MSYLPGGTPESASKSVRCGDTSCANFGVDHTSVRVPSVEQMTRGVEIIGGGQTGVRLVFGRGAMCACVPSIFTMIPDGG
jgi:hypothetical protein